MKQNELESVMQEEKVVHFNLFSPENSLFKQGKNTAAEVQTITCTNFDNCQFITRGECVCRGGLFGKRCQYGSVHRQTGFTRRARKYHSWCSDQAKKYDGVPFLNAPKALGIVGDFVFLPYAHMDMLEQLPWTGSFLKKEDFTIENIISLVKFKPQALFGGEIRAYQKEVPPLFMKHLSEQMPTLFEQVIAEDEYAKLRYQEFSNIGRKAVLETTTPNAGKFKDIHGGLWTWDGETLQSGNSHASFMLVKKFRKLTIAPEGKQVVEITNEGQVNQNTVFVG